MSPTLFDKWVGSLTSHTIWLLTRAMRRDLWFTLLIQEDLKVQPFADVITKATLSPQLLLRPWVLVQPFGFDPGLPHKSPTLNYLNHRSGVCTTVENSPNPSSVYIRLCKHRKTVFYGFYKITSSQSYNAGKDKNNSFYWSKRIFLQH